MSESERKKEVTNAMTTPSANERQQSIDDHCESCGKSSEIEAPPEDTKPMSRFLCLPYEIRAEIYSYLLVLDNVLTSETCANQSLGRLLHPNILQVCKQTYAEGLGTLVNKNLWIYFHADPVFMERSRASTSELREQYSCMAGRWYGQPSLPVGCEALKERLKERALKVTLDPVDVVTEQDAPDIEEGVLFVYHERPYASFTCLVRMLDCLSSMRYKLTIKFPTISKWGRKLNVQLKLLEPLLNTRNVHTFDIEADSIREGDVKDITHELVDTNTIDRLNDEPERLKLEGDTALVKGLFKEAQDRYECANKTMHINAETVAHLMRVFNHDVESHMKREMSLQHDIFIGLAIAVEEQATTAEHVAILENCIQALEQFISQSNFGLPMPEDNDWSLLGRCGHLHRRIGILLKSVDASKAKDHFIRAILAFLRVYEITFDDKNPLTTRIGQRMRGPEESQSIQ
ncbi:hypothetical protein AJ80_01649 [Polytolypa hystricis UAMH7299]|uniref:F-box domain-containing protein n=1 Tax=Polytolypa hystricis (strain UAMH7299) TaxID=1447883 RepID=A0A2B7Z0F0_POLH7|nr:hypothetical protein AJ80_01649 [Polytolypa hystricis UAMH7299]